MATNKWGIVFHEVDTEKQEFRTLLYITGEEIRIRWTFANIKNDFQRNTGKPDCVISLIDVEDNESTVDDHPLTKEQMKSIADSLGFQLGEECIRNDK